MLLLGLTGNVACGKSTVARLLAGFGAATIDSDHLVHELYGDAAFAARVEALFEQPVTRPDGTIDRTALAALVFTDPRLLRRLEAFVHPAVAELRRQKMEALRAAAPPAIVLEAVKLIESGQARECVAVWCVTCPPELQLQRVMARGLSEFAARNLLANQPPFEPKRALLGEIPLIEIENNGAPDDLQGCVAAEWRKLMESRTPAANL